MKCMVRFFPIVTLVLVCGCSAVLKDSKEHQTRQLSATNMMQVESTQPMEDSPADLSVSGEQVKALFVAYAAFQKESEIPPAKRKVENYDIEFRHDDRSYLVWFQPRTSQDKPLVGGETELGVEISYRISKRDLKIMERKFYK